MENPRGMVDCSISNVLAVQACRLEFHPSTCIRSQAQIIPALGRWSQENPRNTSTNQ